jgi:predicted RNase H-like HicB family nuclease
MATRHYLGIAERSTTGWSLSFPAFPGTVTIGDDFSELMANARDALASVVAAMSEDGLAIPQSFDAMSEAAEPVLKGYRNPRLVLVPVEIGGRSMRLNITMDEGLVARLDQLASRANASRSALLARGARLVLAAEAAE